MSSWFPASWRLPPRAPDVELDRRSTVLLLFARATDEVGSGLLTVLAPTLRARLGLSLTELGWCFQAMYGVAAVVEPITATAVDLVRRRPLLVVGAVCWAAALLLAAGAPSLGWLVLAFALVGVGSGPLTATADVVLVEAHPDAVERIGARSTTIDTAGALLAPASVLGASALGLDHRILLVVAGTMTLAYTLLLARALVPAPPAAVTSTSAAAVGLGRAVRAGAHGLRQGVGNLVEVPRHRNARPWVLALLAIELLDLVELYETVLLRDQLGVSQGVVALHATAGLATSLVGLVLLERWLERRPADGLLLACVSASLVLYPLWLLAPTPGGKLALVMLRGLVAAPLWPVLRSRALAAVPGRGGAVAAVSSLLGLLPLAALVGALGDLVGLPVTLLGIHLVAVGGLLTVLLRHRRRVVRPG